jgi:hypothetical protein
VTQLGYQSSYVPRVQRLTNIRSQKKRLPGFHLRSDSLDNSVSSLTKDFQSSPDAPVHPQANPGTVETRRTCSYTHNLSSKYTKDTIFVRQKTTFWQQQKKIVVFHIPD